MNLVLNLLAFKVTVREEWAISHPKPKYCNTSKHTSTHKLVVSVQPEGNLQQQQQHNNDNVKCNEAAFILLLTCEIVMCETTVSHFLLLLLSAFFFMFKYLMCFQQLFEGKKCVTENVSSTSLTL